MQWQFNRPRTCVTYYNNSQDAQQRRYKSKRNRTGQIKHTNEAG